MVFAVKFDINEETKKLSIEGVISYGGLKFLKYCSRIIYNAAIDFNYEYERTFDIPCAINIIMYMKNSDIKKEMTSFKKHSLRERLDESYKYWCDVKKKNENYANLLNLIDNKEISSNFEKIKEEIENLYYTSG